MIIAGPAADAEIDLVKAVAAEESGPASFAYLRLTDEDFERLIYALFKKSTPLNVPRTWNDAAIMVRGADAGRDVLLSNEGQAVCIVQCKRLENAMTLPAVFREISKLILFAKVNADLSFETANLYLLALARDPAGTVVDFFARRPELETARLDDLLAAAREVREQYVTLSGLTSEEAQGEVLRVFPTLTLKLLRPTDLDEWLSREIMVSTRFFRQRLVVDATQVTQGQQELVALLKSMAGKIDAVPLLTDDDLKIIKNRIEQTPETHRLNLGIATLFGYPREMFVTNSDLRARVSRLGQLLMELDGDYTQWIFNQSSALAGTICDSSEVLFKVHPFARQVPLAFLGLVAAECAALATTGNIMSAIVTKATKQTTFDSDAARLDHVSKQLIAAGERYLVGDFSELVGDAALVAFKRRIIAGMMIGLSRPEDLAEVLLNGTVVLKPQLDSAAQKLRDLCSHRTSVFLMGAGAIDDPNAIKRMAETIQALDAMRKATGQRDDTTHGSGKNKAPG